jgi:hypothetical protein
VEIAQDAYPWRPWTPQETASRLDAVAAPWAVAAGWALELFVGEAWRAHEDLELAVPSRRLAEVEAALAGLQLWVPAGEGRLQPLAAARLHESHQTWALDPAARAWRLDVFREPSDRETWICRRDTAIRMPYADLVERTPEGIPFVRPEVVLLFKAKHVRRKDEEDLAVVLPLLDHERRGWLRGALRRVHPDHDWLRRL